MKIFDRNLTGNSAAGASRSQETQRPDAVQSGRETRAVGGSNVDRVEFSGALGRLSRTLSEYGAERAAHVQRLAASYQSGNYAPDSMATSRSMIAEAISAGGK